MIKSFACADSETLFEGGTPARFRAIKDIARRKLDMLNAAEAKRDLGSPPGNRLEKLKGNRADQYSIRINRKWRICFAWRQGAAYDVEIVDYHN